MAINLITLDYKVKTKVNGYKKVNKYTSNRHINKVVSDKSIIQGKVSII